MAALTQAKQIKRIKRYRTKTVLSVGAKAYSLHRKRKFSEMNNLIAEEFTKLGGVYVKFLQGVLLKSSLMRDWKSPNRLNIFENLETEPLDIQQILRSELSSQKLQQIISVSPEPFAAGSFGQVYFGKHEDGTQIIIKVLRPLIRETLVFDLKLLSMFLKTSISKARSMQYDIKEAVQDFKRATLRETDYIEEARFADELYQQYKDHPYFFIPKTYLDLCTKNIIVQEYVPGISVAQLIKFQEQGVDVKDYMRQNFNSDLDQQLTTAGVELMYGIFALPRIQGDPHPGNIKLLENNRVGMIDFGISAKSPKEKAAFYALMDEYQRLLSGSVDVPALFGQFLRFFVSDLYKALKRLAAMSPGENASDDLIRQMGAVAERNFQKEMNVTNTQKFIEKGNILGMMNTVVNKGNRFGMVMKLDDSEMLRSAQSYLTLVDSMGGKTTIFPKILRQALDRVAQDFPEYIQDAPELPSVNRAMETISKWLERVADKDPALFRTIMRKLSHAQPKLKKVKLPNVESTKDEDANKVVK